MFDSPTTTKIEIRVAGDRWMNPDEVAQQIQNCRGEHSLLFTVNSEGPSFYALGIIDVITKNITEIGIPPDQVWIDGWHNMKETIPFKRVYQPKISHFFWMSDSYRHATRLPFADSWPMAFFVGRLTFERSVMLWDVSQRWPSQVLISLMRQSGQLDFSLEHVTTPWIDPDRSQEFMNWIQSSPFESITGHSVRDQYIPDNNTNRDLVAHYDRFSVELVAETYCLGDTFFPTEKIVRPISQGKPVLVYGPRYFLARLRELGFQTWGDIWNESYDELTGHDRWEAIATVADHVITAKTYLDPKIEIISQHNIRVLNNIIDKYGPYDYSHF
jgi:hypothetical protein